MASSAFYTACSSQGKIYIYKQEERLFGGAEKSDLVEVEGSVHEGASLKHFKINNLNYMITKRARSNSNDFRL